MWLGLESTSFLPLDLQWCEECRRMRLVLFSSCEDCFTRTSPSGSSPAEGTVLTRHTILPLSLDLCEVRCQPALEAGAFVYVKTLISTSPHQGLTSHSCCPSSAFGSASEKWEDHPEGRRSVGHRLSWISCVFLLWPWVGFMDPWK